MTDSISQAASYLTVSVFIGLAILRGARMLRNAASGKTATPDNILPQNVVTGRGFSISVSAEKTDHLAFKQAVGIEDVVAYLLQVKEKKPGSLIGIDSVIISDLNHKISIYGLLLGTYEPFASKKKKGVIRLYPLRYSQVRKKFYLQVFEEIERQVELTLEEGRELQLLTLGHEIGHNEVYRKTRGIKGRAVEKAADDFAESLKLTRKRGEIGRLVHRDCP